MMIRHKISFVYKLMTKNAFKLVAAAFLLVLGFGVGFSALAGFGISPSGINLTDILRGNQIERVIVLSRSQPTEDILIEAKTEGEVANWIQLERGGRFTYPSGEKQFPVKIIISVPKSAANGSYEGKISFIGAPAGSCESGDCQGASVGVSLGAIADVRITVTDREIKDFRILGVQVDKARANEKLALILFLENNGNVEIQPDHIIVDIFDKFHKIQIGSFTVSKFDGKILPKNSGPVKAIIPWVPDADNYWAEVSVFDNKNQLVAKENLAFETEAGDGTVTTKDKTEKSGNNLVYIIISSIGGALLLLFLGGIFFMKHLKKMLLNQAPRTVSPNFQRMETGTTHHQTDLVSNIKKNLSLKTFKKIKCFCRKKK
jgi:hypothetical protein